MNESWTASADDVADVTTSTISMTSHAASGAANALIAFPVVSVLVNALVPVLVKYDVPVCDVMVRAERYRVGDVHADCRRCGR